MYHHTSLNRNNDNINIVTRQRLLCNSVLCDSAVTRIVFGMKCKDAGVMVQKHQPVIYTWLSSLQPAPKQYVKAVKCVHASHRTSITTGLHKSRSDWHCGLHSAISGCRYYVYGLFLIRAVMTVVVKGMRLCVSSAHIAVAG